MAEPRIDLDKIYEQIAKPDSRSAVDPKIARARDLVSLIERVSSGETAKETAKAQGTLGHPGVDFIPEPGKTATLSRIGRFKIREIIGQGGFGLVFKALDPNLNREVALKIPKTFHILSDDLRERFLREGRATASLAHPNIVPVYDAGQADAICFMASQLINGQSLATWLAENPAPVAPKLAVQIVATLADAIEHAHQRGILHRDIKPANILIDSDVDSESLADRLKIADFGLAKELTVEQDQTATGEMIGTPAYMSPEQTTDYRQVGPRSDIYSLGAVLHELLTGSPPFKRENLFDTISDVRHKNAESICQQNPAVSRDLEAICLKCLEKKPDRRYSTAHELKQDLVRYLNGEPTHARQIGRTTRMLRWCFRNPLASALFAVLGISSIAVSFLLYRSENLRALSESRGTQLKVKTEQLQTKTEQLQTKTEQLHDAIQRLFTEVAETPELRASGLDSLRQRLIGQASEVYSQIVDEVPDDIDLLKKYLATKLNFARLSDSLGDSQQAMITTNELLDLVNTQLGKLEEDDQRKKQFLIIQTGALALKLNLLESDREGIAQQKQVAKELLTLVETKLMAIDDVEVMMAQASALSDIAAHRTWSSITEAGQLNDRARSIWKKIPAESFSHTRYADSLVNLYHASIMAIASAEDSEKGVALCDEFYALLANLNSMGAWISPVSEMYIADIHRQNGFLLRDDNVVEAIRLSEQGRDLSLDLAARHPLVASFQMHVTAQLYTLGLMYYFARDLDEAEAVFVDNVGRCERLIRQFPNQSRTGRLNLANSLTMLGLLYKNREQWNEQLATLNKAMIIVEDDLKKSNATKYKVSKCGLQSEIAQAHAKLGEFETALGLISSSIRQLENIVVADPENGNARRFLANNLNRACEINRRCGQFEDAREYLDRLMELLGKGMLSTLLPAAIEIEIAAGNEDLVSGYLARYRVESSQLNPDQRLFDSRQFCWAIHTLALNAAEYDQAIIEDLRNQLVGVACANLSAWQNSAQDPQAAFAEIAGHADFLPLKNEPAFMELGRFD